MAETLIEVYYVKFYEGNKVIGYWDNEDECITKNKNHITYFDNEDAALEALEKCGITDKEYSYKVDVVIMSMEEFMTEH